MNRKTILLVAFAVMTAMVYLGCATVGGRQLEPEGNFEWERVDNGIRITGYTGNAAHLRIPPRIQGMPVTEIWDSAFMGGSWRSTGTGREFVPGGHQLTSVTIPDTVTMIGHNAFMNNRLTSVAIGNSVTSIGRAAFEANLLSSITIPNSVRFIGDHAFRYNQLPSVVIGNSVTSIGYAAFWGNQLASITVPHSVTSIGDFAFGNATVTRQ